MPRRRRRRSRRGPLSGVLTLLAFGAVVWAAQHQGAVVWVTRHLGPLVQAEGPAPAGTSAGAAGYERKAWPHWSDADGDCQDTRQEVLIAESEIPVKFRSARRCKVAEGRWRCPYTGRVFTDPKDLDVDHLVPLAEAHRAGGHAWDRARRERYANALDDPTHLVAVERGANRAKADKGPEDWMPPAEEYRCEYLQSWRSVKQRWGLQMDPRERAYVERARQACARGEIPPLPGA